GAAKSIDRVIEVFPSTEQGLIRSTLADGIRAIISQVLFKRIDKKGRCVALEILIATAAIRNLIRESKSHQIPSMVQTGKKYGMQLLDDAIMELYNKGWISAEEAYSKANEKQNFRPLLKTPPQDFTEA
ncbi:MAG: type IV pili twitching motility protein PilT, partial [Deltaproteobacteria bacterium]|nr:type IV pili twitching motility protein PilT [Deltaproteobacteria bacterium]